MYSTKILLQLVLIAVLITAFSCNSSTEKKDGTSKKSGDPTGDSFNPYYPLKEGNKWIYVSDGPTDETEMFIVEASGEKKVENGIQLKVSSFPYFTKESREKTLIIKHNGEVIAGDIFGASGMVFPAADNFKSGYTWTFGNFGGNVASENETIETGAGSFKNCIKLNMTDGFTFAFELWFKKDVGIIKWGANRTNPPILKAIYYELKEYKLN
ncbi:MAG: hypothetical protein IT281_05975 [Ignavibacteria bacterium]|nr:hypothetical protein [Ignavibacteria bacterium]MCC7159064.1 hypothetical protein [Ignavibacteria bacterium]